MSSFSIDSYLDVDLWNLSNSALTLARILLDSYFVVLLASFSTEGY